MAEKIGLQAVFETAAFNAGLKQYMSGMDQATKGTGKAASAVQGLSRVFDTVLKAGIVAATAALTAASVFLGESVKAAMDAEEVMADLNAVLASTGEKAGVTADAATQLATSLASVTKFEDETIITGESMLLTFTNIGKNVFPLATEAMLNMAQKMGTDVKTSAMQLGKALNDPIKGVTTLRRVGVMLTDQQERQIKRLVALGKTEEAQKMILAELETEFGGLARAAGETAAGKLTILKNKFGDLKEAIGTSMLPLITTLSTRLIKFFDSPALKSGIDKFGKSLNRIAMGFSAGMKTGGWTLLTALGMDGRKAQEVIATITKVFAAIQTGFNFIRTNAAAITGALGGIMAVLTAAKVITTIIAVVNGIKNIIIAVKAATTVLGAIGAVTNPVTLAIMGIAAAAALLGAAWAGNWGGIRDIITDVWVNSIQPALSGIWSWLQTNIPIALNYLVNLWNTVFLPALTSFWDWVSTNLIPLFVAIGELIGVTIVYAVTKLVEFWNTSLLPALQTVGQYLSETFTPLWEAFDEVLNERIIPTINSIVKWIEEKLASAFEWVTAKIQEAIAWIGQIVSAVRSLTGASNSVGPKTTTSTTTSSTREQKQLMKQTGGSFTRGSYLVGEKRPEVVTFNRSGFIYPSVSSYLNSYAGRQMTGFAGSSPSVTVQVNGDINNGMDAAALSAFILQTVQGAFGMS